jgi:cysteine-rich repeat protein
MELQRVDSRNVSARVECEHVRHMVSTALEITYKQCSLRIKNNRKMLCLLLLPLILAYSYCDKNSSQRTCDFTGVESRDGYCTLDGVCLSMKTHCGNGVLEKGEECDDGNIDRTDSCVDCRMKNDCVLSTHGDALCGQTLSRLEFSTFVGMPSACVNIPNNTASLLNVAQPCKISEKARSFFVIPQSKSLYEFVAFSDPDCSAHSESAFNFHFQDGECGGSLVFGCGRTVRVECKSRSVCGNGIVEDEEECDPGNVRSAHCTEHCRIRDVSSSVCGNGVLESGEQCDDGNDDPNDGCNDCTLFMRCAISHDINGGTSCWHTSLTGVYDIMFDESKLCLNYNTLYCGRNSVAISYDAYFSAMRYDIYDQGDCKKPYMGSMFGEGCFELEPSDCLVNPSLLVDCKRFDVCGDGVVTGDEQCDPGDLFDNTDCTQECRYK